MLTLITLGAVVGLVFQNCADPLGSSSNQSSFSKSLPFGYDSTVDTIAYMSCSASDAAATSQAIWTLRAGAYGSNSGVRLRQGFIDLTRNFSISNRAAALAQSPANAGSDLQLAIRPASNFQAILTSSGSTGEFGEDYSNLISGLDSSEIATQLASVDLKNPQRINYFSGVSGLNGRNVEGSIRFLKDETEANSVRGFLTNTGLLTATYSDSTSSPYAAKAPSGSSSIYGRGYKLQFNFLGPYPYARVISSVQELDLETGRTPSDSPQWSCPSQLKLYIKKSCDTDGNIGEDECPCLSDSASDPALVSQARRVLRVEDWYVNIGAACIKQKTTTSQCYPPNQATSVTGLHFVSICLRTN